jgi:hypothetical protein
MPKYPEWVKQHREPGTSAKKVGNSYYLYKTTSVRVPGKKNPQPKSEYIGIITPEGVVKTGVRKTTANTVRVYEYGFSYALKQLMPASFTRGVRDKEKAKLLLLHIIRQYSPHSYLLRGIALPPAEDRHVSLPVQTRRYERLSGIRIQDLLPLGQLYLVEIDGREMVSEITPEIAGIMAKAGVTL